MGKCSPNLLSSFDLYLEDEMKWYRWDFERIKLTMIL